VFSSEEYKKRLAGMASGLYDRNIDLAVVTHLPDLFYFSGTSKASYLFVSSGGQAWLACRRGAAGARGETGLPVEEFVKAADLTAICNIYLREPPRRVGFSFEISRLEQAALIKKLFEHAEPVDITRIVAGLRQIKSAAELELIRLAGRQLDGAFKTAASLLRLGQSELELAIRIEAYMRRKGHPGIVRTRNLGTMPMGFVAAGVSTSTPAESDVMACGPGLSPALPIGPGEHEFEAGEPVIFDYCGCCAGYLADQTRMLSVGKPADEAGWAYEAMRQVLRRLEAHLRPGQETGRLYDLALREASFLGYEDYFMQNGKNRLPYVGHGVGLELDEPPLIARDRREKLEPGMVFALEPKVALPGLGVIGVENTYAITDTGFEKFTLAEDTWRQIPVD